MLSLLDPFHSPHTRRAAAARAAAERDVAALGALLEAYLRLFRYGRISPLTLRQYRSAIGRFLGWLEGHLLRCDDDTLRQYALALSAQGLAPATVAGHLAAVQALFRALRWAGALRESPHIPRPYDPTPPEQRRPGLPAGYYVRLLEHLEAESEFHGLRTLVLVRLMGELGLRVSEALNLRLSDLEGQRLRIQGKGGKVRYLPLSPGLKRDLPRYLAAREGWARSDWLIVGTRPNPGDRLSAAQVGKILNRLYRRLGFEQEFRGCHCLRHTAGTRFYRISRDLLVTAALLGHANLQNSRIYAKITQDDLEAVIRGIPL